MPDIPPPLIVRPRAIQVVTGLSKSQALRLEKTNPDFPKRVKISPRVSGWLYSELQDYFQNLPRY
jgi:predicted DNA-binding transcriptional regulator AlpA